MATGVDEAIPKWEDWNEFGEWCWSGNNCNKLIARLNDRRWNQSDYIRRERYRPVLHSIVLNDYSKYGKTWKFCHVGLSTESESNDKIEQLLKKYETGSGKTSVLFVLPINAIDTTPLFDIETRIRQNFGVPVSEELATDLNFPDRTEWVINTQNYIGKVMKKIKQIKDEDEVVSTAVFKDDSYKFDLEKAPALPDWLQFRMNGEIKEIYLKDGASLPSESNSSRHRGSAPSESKRRAKRRTPHNHSSQDTSPRRDEIEILGHSMQSCDLLGGCGDTPIDCVSRDMRERRGDSPRHHMSNF